MSAGAAHALRDIQDAVRVYLRSHPHAADTPVGIRQWWLPESMRSMPIELLRLALARMAASGELRCQALSDGTRLYALARSESGAERPP